MKRLSILSAATLTLFLTSVAFAQTTPGTSEKCSAGKIRSYANAKGNVDAAAANLKLAEEALELVKEHQARLDASFESVKAAAIAATNDAPESTKSVLLNLANKWSEKALKVRNRAKEKALKAAQKAVASATAKKEKAQERLTGATPKECSL